MYGDNLYSKNDITCRIKNLIKNIKDGLEKAGIFSTQTGTTLDIGIADVCSVI